MSSALDVREKGLRQVTHLLAVSSCKGGVGKSTTAVNLACALAQTGRKTGIFDADIYGPSLPTMVTPEEDELYGEEGMVLPMNAHGLKMMSFGWVPTGAGGGGANAAIMRGPMVTQIVNQLLTGTAWGELDVLVIDFPPGTGDIQLTLGQIANLTGAVIVTTPQNLSYVDVVKGIQMFEKLSVPVLAAVENMSTFTCDGCDKVHRPFGEGAKKRLIADYGFEHILELPIDPALSRHGDEGIPFVIANPDHPVSQSFRELATEAWTRLESVNDGQTELVYNVGQSMMLVLPDGTELECEPADLRRACRCAHCVEEMTGRQILDPASVPDTIYPNKVRPMGNYAAAVEWSDGHESIYPFAQIMHLFS